MSNNQISKQLITAKILIIRGQKVLIDRDLANLYGVPTKSLNLAVKRNPERFPKEFMFQLTKEELDSLRFQNETSKGRGGSRYLPYAFTEHGVAMLSSVLNSKRAVEVNIAIIKTFVRLRETIAAHKELSQKLGELENKLGKHDKEIQLIFSVIKQLMEKPAGPKKRIGFH